MLSFFPLGVLDEILNLIESVSEGFTTYSSFSMVCRCACQFLRVFLPTLSSLWSEVVHMPLGFSSDKVLLLFCKRRHFSASEDYLSMYLVCATPPSVFDGSLKLSRFLLHGL